MKLKKKTCALALAGAVALSALSLGFASWQTTITGGGDVSASGKWEVAVTEATLHTSSDGCTVNPIYTEPEDGYQFYYPGTRVTDFSLYNLGNAVAPVTRDTSKALGEKLPTLIADRTSANGKTNTRPWLFAIDTTRGTPTTPRTCGRYSGSRCWAGWSAPSLRRASSPCGCTKH